MSAGISFWKRLGSAFRADESTTNGGSGNRNQPMLSIETADPQREDNRDSRNAGSSGLSLLPWVRRRKSLEQLRAGYQRMLELMDAMSLHFERQDRRAEELTAGVDRVGRTLEQLANAQRAQNAHLASIAGRVDDAVKQSVSLSTTLREMPAAFQTHTEAIRTVAREMEATRAADAQFVQQFRQATDSLQAAGTAQVETLRRLHDTGEDQKESLRVFVRNQTRLLVVIAIVVMVLGLAAVGALAVVAHMVFDQ